MSRYKIVNVKPDDIIVVEGSKEPFLIRLDIFGKPYFIKEAKFYIACQRAIEKGSVPGKPRFVREVKTEYDLLSASMS